jgi:hypothetical protein
MEGIIAWRRDAADSSIHFTARHSFMREWHHPNRAEAPAGSANGPSTMSLICLAPKKGIRERDAGWRSMLRYPVT